MMLLKLQAHREVTIEVKSCADGRFDIWRCLGLPSEALCGYSTELYKQQSSKMCKRCEVKTFCDFGREPWFKNKTEDISTNAISSVARYRSREGLSQSELDELIAAYKQETEFSDALELIAGFWRLIWQLPICLFKCHQLSVVVYHNLSTCPSSLRRYEYENSHSVRCRDAYKAAAPAIWEKTGLTSSQCEHVWTPMTM